MEFLVYPLTLFPLISPQLISLGITTGVLLGPLRELCASLHGLRRQAVLALHEVRGCDRGQPVPERRRHQQGDSRRLQQGASPQRGSPSKHKHTLCHSLHPLPCPNEGAKRREKTKM